jgi:glycosyltransferase involved in cell wall biosynthesis
MVALARPACGKLVLSEHSATNHRIGRAVFRPVEYFIYGRFDPIVCVAENVYKKLSSWLPGLSKRMTVVLNGIDLVRFSSAAPIDTKQFGVPAGAPVCVMVARFYPPKDQKTLINAAALIPGLHVLLAGEGDLEQAMRDHAARKGVADRVHFLGYRDDIHALVKACDVYVYSSHFEGMPLAVAEAMACGAPVVGSNVDGVNEIVQDKKSGLLFESGNEKDLAEKIGVVLRDAGVRAALRSGSLARSKDFSLDTMVTRLLSLYSA